MHPLFADWYKLADLNPTADVLHTRWSGVEIGMKSLDAGAVLRCTRLSFELAGPSAASDGAQLATAFKEADVAFPMKGNENLLRVLAGVTLAQCIESKHPQATLAALCVASASCRALQSQPSIEELPGIADGFLRSEGQRVRHNGHSARARSPKLSKLELANPAAIELQDVGTNQWAQIQHNFQHVKAWLAQASTAIQALSAGLTSTQAEVAAALNVDAESSALETRLRALQEECDVLWWLFGENSERLGLVWKRRSAAEMCLVLGQELAALFVYYAPAPNTDAFLAKALSLTASQDSDLDLQGTIDSAPLEWVRELSNRLGAPIARAGTLTPLHAALLRRLDSNAALPNRGQFSAGSKMTALDCAHQMLLETLLLEMMED